MKGLQFFKLYTERNGREVQHFNKERFAKAVQQRAPKTPSPRNCLAAFTVGGGICVLGEALLSLYSYLGLAEKTAVLAVTVTLVFLAALLTFFGVFDRIARFAGAGTLVPVTGFANSVVSPAMDNKSEGLVLGVGAKIFTVAGPVLLYGTVAGALYGIVYSIVLWIGGML
jgi:stage V sporulation protein AC